MDRVYVAKIDEIEEGVLLRKDIGPVVVLLTKIAGVLHAVENRCPHLGLPIAKGKVCDGAVTCPWHGSKFDLATGENIDWTNSFVGVPMPKWTHNLIALGKAPEALKSFKVECEEELVYICL
ncbi:MAG: Rieske (2Fe-2S) protein [Spongiibacteraceae bacterium]